MATVNNNFSKLKNSYLFSEIAKKVAAYKAQNPGKKVISLGIGDVTRPLPRACVDAMHKALDELTNENTFRGYGPEKGYSFLREPISSGEYKLKGIDISPDEIFISDGAKSDTGNIGDILGKDNIVAIPDPVYPVYFDTNVMAGRKVKFIPCRESDGFAALPPDFHADIVYLCSPNNPTGSALNRTQLKAWVDYALKNDALILYDAAYERFISQDDVPHSIFEIEGALKCAIEFRSFSKTAGFTGVRCAYTVIPSGLTAKAEDGTKVPLHTLWNRRQCTKFNGTSYIVQRGAAAIYTPEGRTEIAGLVGYYLENARLILDGLRSAGFSCIGGVNAPYIWLKCPDGMDSWSFFARLLNEAAVVGTPGEGFGENGEGFFRLTSFGGREDTIEAIERIVKVFG